MATVKASEARARLSDLLNRVARSEKIRITRYVAAVALLVPFEEKKSKLAHREIVQGMRALRKRVMPRNISLRGMVAEGEFHRRLGHSSEAEISFHRALDFARTEPQQRFLLRKLAALRGAEG